jgi:type II secretory pathway component GspD/PulD (secretin)
LTFHKCVVGIYALFLSKSPANTQQKTETLIFITPRILSESLVN